MLRAVVFDLDGIIIDSESLHLTAYQEVLAARGIALSTNEYAGRYLGLDDPVIFQQVSLDRGLDWAADDIARLVDEKVSRYRAAISLNPRLFPGAAECIARLAREVPLAVASGALREEIEHVLALTRLRRYFRVLVGSNDTPRSKPAPDPYARAVQLIGSGIGCDLPPCQFVGIEDSIRGIESACAAGLRTVAVTNTYSTCDLTGADLIVESLDELNIETLRRLCA